MILKDTTSCAMQEITGLSGIGSPLEAMKAFCRLTFDEKGETSARFGSERTSKGSLYSFYLFSAAVELGKMSAKTGYYAPYGLDFAKFIRDNKLGEVWESPVRQNKTFHAGHGNQIYVWTIDQAAVKEWWGKNNTPVVSKPVKQIPEEDFILEEIDYINI